MKFKKINLSLAFILIFGLVLGACTATDDSVAVVEEALAIVEAAADSAAVKSEVEQTGEEVVVEENVSEAVEETVELSSTQLILGSFLLEDAGIAITVEQAVQMVQMWKVYQSMMESDTTAEAEREALINQIAGIFTIEQQNFLASADTGQESIQTIMTDLGIKAQEMGGGGQRGSNSEGDGENTGRPEAGEEGVVGGRDGGGGQGGDMAGQDIDEEQQAAMQAERAAAGGGAQDGGQMDTMLLPYLIEMLGAIV